MSEENIVSKEMEEIKLIPQSSSMEREFSTSEFIIRSDSEMNFSQMSSSNSFVL
jgi:hypothetical protein